MCTCKYTFLHFTLMYGPVLLYTDIVCTWILFRGCFAYIQHTSIRCIITYSNGFLNDICCRFFDYVIFQVLWGFRILRWRPTPLLLLCPPCFPFRRGRRPPVPLPPIAPL